MSEKRVIVHKTEGPVTVQDIANVIDHSLLQPNMTIQTIEEGCDIAAKYNCVSVCVRASELGIAMEKLKDTDVLVTTVIGFPHGATTTKSKVFETIDAVETGAVEVDMVLNIGRLISGDYDYVYNDIAQVVKAAHERGALVKVIFENSYLTDEQKKKACKICEDAGADFVKTSTGYAPTGATIEDLKLMRSCCSPKVQVKAAGGVKDLDAALAVMATGTVRIGTRSTVDILEEAIKREKLGTLAINTEGKLGEGY